MKNGKYQNAKFLSFNFTFFNLHFLCALVNSYVKLNKGTHHRKHLRTSEVILLRCTVRTPCYTGATALTEHLYDLRYPFPLIYPPCLIRTCRYTDPTAAAQVLIYSGDNRVMGKLIL